MTGGPPSGLRGLSAEDPQEALLNANQVVKPPAQVFVVASGRSTPRVEKDRIGPLGVRHEIA